MTDLMQTIYDHLLDDSYKNFLPQDYYWHHYSLLTKRESALSETLSETQQDLFDAYQQAERKNQLLELETMFQAAWAASRELR